jgi:DNA modification methylase
MELNNIYLIDCIEGMKELPDNSVDSIVTDAPYELGFMGKKWDSTGIAYNVDVWREALRVLKPGGHLLSFGGTRTYHRMACAIEDAGFEIRDMISWMYGSGFPKSLDVSKTVTAFETQGNSHSSSIRKARMKDNYKPTGQLDWKKGAQFETPKDYQKQNSKTELTENARKWEGWGTALKPAQEPIVVARKPLLERTVAKNVLRYGTGGINIDDCRIEANNRPLIETREFREGVEYNPHSLAGRVDGSLKSSKAVGTTNLGRWPANIIHDGSEEVISLFPQTKSPNKRKTKERNSMGYHGGETVYDDFGYGDEGSASRFFYKAEFSEEDIAWQSFYCSKASKKERGGFNNHPTVKPLKLMQYLVRLVTPPLGVCLDPFAGSGTTLLACARNGFNYIGFDNDAESVEIARKRLDLWQAT